MKKGISPIIAFVITVSLISVAVTIVLSVINPAFNKGSDSTNTNDIMKNLELINSAIRQVSSESEGSKRTININSGEGNCFVNSTGDYIYCDYETKTDYVVEGTIGNVRIDKSPVFTDYFNHYTEGSSGSPLWIVKNGTWAVNSGEYSGQNGLAYYHHGNLGFFSLESRI